jgi:integrase
VQQLVDELLASDASPSSVRNTLDPLRAIYRRAIQREQVAINPTSNLDVPSSRRKPVRIAPPAQARALLDALPSEDRATWAAAFYAGLRRGELRALRCSDIDLGASTIRVERSWDQHEGPIAPKSDTSTRTVPLLAVLRDYLDEHLIRTGRSGDDLMFGRTPADPFVPSTLRHRAIRVWEAAGLDAIGLHEARHSFASVLIASDENPKAVQDAMGHSSIKVTFDLYGHLFPGARDELRVRVDRYLEAEAELPDGTTVGQ